MHARFKLQHYPNDFKVTAALFYTLFRQKIQRP